MAIPPQPPRISVRVERTSLELATQHVLGRYGSELKNFLSSRTTTRVSMEDVFSMVSEDVWKGLPSVREREQVRSWLYVVARNALARHLRLKHRWRSRHVSAELDELHTDARRSVATQLSDVGELEPILASLGEEDRRLLEQRSLLAMPWHEIARESARRGGRTSSVDVARESARLRKRYQLLVQNLRGRLADAARASGG